MRSHISHTNVECLQRTHTMHTFDLMHAAHNIFGCIMKMCVRICLFFSCMYFLFSANVCAFHTRKQGYQLLLKNHYCWRKFDPVEHVAERRKTAHIHTGDACSFSLLSLSAHITLWTEIGSYLLYLCSDFEHARVNFTLFWTRL